MCPRAQAPLPPNPSTISLFCSTFRYCCRARAQKVEEKDLKYALLTEVIRDGGLKMAIMVRYSAIPGHSTSCLFPLASATYHFPGRTLSSPGFLGSVISGSE